MLSVAPRSHQIRVRIPVRFPSRSAPTSTSSTSAPAGLAAAKSSLRVIASRTGRRVASTADTTSGSGIIILPPNPPPSGAQRTRTRSTGRPNSDATSSRVMNGACVEVLTISSSSTSNQAVAVWGSM